MTDMPDNMSSSRTHDQNMSTKRGNIDTSDDALVERVAQELTGLIGGLCCHRTGGRNNDPKCECREYARAAIAVLRPAIRAEALREALDALWSGPRYDRDVFDSMTKTVDGVWLREDDINCAILALIDKERE